MTTRGVWLRHFLRDLRYSVRNLSADWTFTLITVSSLALGIGGATAMYSVIYGVILNPFPYQDVDRLMSVQVLDGSGRSNFSHYPIDQFLEIAERNAVFAGVIASTWSDVTWTGTGEPQRLRGNHCTMNTFALMGVPPLLGRPTQDSDARAGAEPVAILGYRFWQRAFGGDPRVVGTRMQLNGRVRTVIGVMPPRFMWRGADVYLPDVLRRGQSLEGETEVNLLGRLKPALSRAQAEADLTRIVEEMKRRKPTSIPDKWRVRLRNFKETFPSGITDALWILFGAVGLLLLIACVNVSNLMLSRLAERQKELAIRAALGAPLTRLLSQLLAEASVLALAGAACGALVAYGGLQAIITMVPPDTIPDEAVIRLNGPVLWFTLALSVTTAMLVGLAPALQLLNADVMQALREEGRTATESGRQQLARSALVAGEIALSLMLLSGACLMVRTLFALQTIDLGIPAHRILTLRVPLSNERFKTLESRNAFFDEVMRRIAAIPGVNGVGINTGLPPLGNWHLPVQVPGSTQSDERTVELHQVNAEYAKALGLIMVSGRFLAQDDVRLQRHYAVANQAFVRRYFGGGEAIGHAIRLQQAPGNLANDSFEVVGVVKDMVNEFLTQQRAPELYIPFTVLPMAERIYVASTVKPDSLDSAVRHQVYAVDPTQPVTDVRTLTRMLDQYLYSRPRFNLLLFGVFAALGLIMALLGVYGVISAAVAQRTREIGIRVALGASARQVMGMVLVASARLLGIGIGAGLLGTLLSARTIAHMVHVGSPLDPLSLGAVILLLFATGLLASFWPARHAARIDPIEALRDE